MRTPFGRPVEPEVKMTYAVSSGLDSTGVSEAGALEGSSTSRTLAFDGGSSRWIEDCETMTDMWASSTMKPRRSAGNAESIGT